MNNQFAEQARRIREQNAKLLAAQQQRLGVIKTRLINELIDVLQSEKTVDEMAKDGTFIYRFAFRDLNVHYSEVEALKMTMDSNEDMPWSAYFNCEVRLVSSRSGVSGISFYFTLKDE